MKSHTLLFHYMNNFIWGSSFLDLLIFLSEFLINSLLRRVSLEEQAFDLSFHLLQYRQSKLIKILFNNIKTCDFYLLYFVLESI